MDMDAEAPTFPSHSLIASCHDPNPNMSGVRRRPRRSPSEPGLQSATCTPLHIHRPVDPRLDFEPSPLHTLASLRFLVLSYLADLEHRLTQLEFQFDLNFDSKALEAWKLQGEQKLQVAKVKVKTGLEMLQGIRADVCSHFPELPITTSTLRSCFRDLSIPDLPFLEHLSDLSLTETVRAHLPDVNMHMHIPTLSDLNLQTGVDDVLSEMRYKLSEFDFRQPFHYIPTLSESLQNLHHHLSSMPTIDAQLVSDIPLSLGFDFKPNNYLSELLDSLLKSDVVKATTSPYEITLESEEILQCEVIEVSEALKRSLHGLKLIKYSDLPHPWQNNPFVTEGYRFIPIEEWPLLIKSLFRWHNETLNIHTHFVPFLFWLVLFSTVESFTHDTAEFIYMSFALLCLLSSSVFHTMMGCAHLNGMELCSTVDYIGIGWLISASVASSVFYAFPHHPKIKMTYLGFCLVAGVASSIFPFVKWFNQFEYRFYRITFFVALAMMSFCPILTICFIHSAREAFAFVSPAFPSIFSYIVGLVFYACHFPERILSEEARRKLDMYGCSSHTIWHCFVVLAVYQHKTAMALMRNAPFQHLH